jgi:TRAP-type mannitol/chloroaromatic compound transport system permease small subunit
MWKVVDAIARFGLWVSAVFIFLASLCVCYAVFTRYVLQDPSVHAYELAKMFMVASLVFSVAYLERTDGHISIDILLRSWRQTTQRVIRRIAVPLVGLIYTLSISYKGWTAAVYSYTVGERSQSIWAEPLYPIKFTIPFGYGLLSLVLVLTFIHEVLRLFRWKQE